MAINVDNSSWRRCPRRATNSRKWQHRRARCNSEKDALSGAAGQCGEGCRDVLLTVINQAVHCDDVVVVKLCVALLQRHELLGEELVALLCSE